MLQQHFDRDAVALLRRPEERGFPEGIIAIDVLGKLSYTVSRGQNAPNQDKGKKKKRATKPGECYS